MSRKRVRGISWEGFVGKGREGEKEKREEEELEKAEEKRV